MGIKMNTNFALRVYDLKCFISFFLIPNAYKKYNFSQIFFLENIK